MKKYVGVDLGAWYGKKTRIAILAQEENEENSKLNLLCIGPEPSEQKEEPEDRNKKLFQYFKKRSKGCQTIIAIDAPFAIPANLKGSCEEFYDVCIKKNEVKLENLAQINNSYLFDNSARFILERTKQIVLAPTATLVGALTSRMVHIVDKYSEELGICKTPTLDKNHKQISTVEVFPTATLYQLILNTILDKTQYLEAYNKAEKDSKNHTKIKSYKNDNWNKDNKKRMIALICPYLSNSYKDLSKKIKTDDDYDAIICALTAYLIDKYDYEKPLENELKKFTNSFIYFPCFDCTTEQKKPKNCN